MHNSFLIGDKKVGLNYEPYYIADIGANHDGDLQRAYKLIELVKECGGHAAKFQNFKASKIVSKYGFENLNTKMSHQANWKKSVFEIYEDASINPDWTPLLKEKCNEVGLDYFSSPYDIESINLIDSFVDLYKIGSGDITWLEIIEYIASKNKPILLATGASDLSDVTRAMDLLLSKNVPLCLMQCNTNYTLNSDKYKFVNLNVLDLYAKMYPNVVLGLSDHTIGFATTLGAIAKGARLIEKHFTDSNENEGPDHKFAMNPKSWSDMVKYGNELFYSLGDGIKRVEENEIDSKIVQQRSLRINKDIMPGHVILKDDIEVLRPKPFGSLEPYRIDEIINRKVNKEIKCGNIITLNDIEND
ncbi:MAG: N-acetylneuraminate synthase family protein [Crocinitomicaceae bacterium]|nr:N-acetylneuraminate synthase family protein [Crocinitomicaceae bacterium]